MISFFVGCLGNHDHTHSLWKPRNLFVCVSEESEDRDQGERDGKESFPFKDTQGLSLSSGKHRIHTSLVDQVDR